MSEKQRKVFGAAFKAKVDLEAIHGAKTINCVSKTTVFLTFIIKLNGKAKTVSGSPSLADNRQVQIAEGVTPDQILSGLRNGQQASAFSGSQNGTTGHKRASWKRRFLIKELTGVMGHAISRR